MRPGPAGALLLGIGALGLLVLGVAWPWAPWRAAAAYLIAWAWCVTIALGAVFAHAIAHACGARWFLPIERQASAIGSTMVLWALAAIPIALSLDQLYAWAGLLDMKHALAVLHKKDWLNEPFFRVRMAGYLVLWVLVAETLHRRQIVEGDFAIRRRAACIALPILGLTTHFAAVDWFMSLEPSWYSTIYGVVIFAGAVVGGLALWAILFAIWRHGSWGEQRSRAHDLAKYLHAFIIFWAYVSYAQLLIIWISDVPESIQWYLPRLSWPWGALALVDLIGHGALPFVLLLFRPLKRRPAVLAVIATWMLLMHYADLYWILMPSISADPPGAYWLDAAAVVGLGGVGGAVLLWRGARVGHA